MAMRLCHFEFKKNMVIGPKMKPSDKSEIAWLARDISIQWDDVTCKQILVLLA